MNIVGRVAGELDEYLLGCLEILPRALGSDVDAAVGVARPAVVPRIEKVVWVHVCRLLMPIVTTTVQPVLRLERR